jgi:hypothetical protein
MSIWSNIDFSENKQPSAYEMLEGQADHLILESGGVLKMEIHTIQAQTVGKSEELVLLYALYITAPKLGGYRRKILTIAESVDQGRFPVEIIAHLIDGGKRFQNVSRENFLEIVGVILAHPAVRTSIEDLYQMSRKLA